LQFYFNRARSATWAVRLRGSTYRLRRLGNSYGIALPPASLQPSATAPIEAALQQKLLEFSMTGPCYGTVTTKGNIIVPSDAVFPNQSRRACLLLRSKRCKLDLPGF